MRRQTLLNAPLMTPCFCAPMMGIKFALIMKFGSSVMNVPSHQLTQSQSHPALALWHVMRVGLSGWIGMIIFDDFPLYKINKEQIEQKLKDEDENCRLVSSFHVDLSLLSRYSTIYLSKDWANSLLLISEIKWSNFLLIKRFLFPFTLSGSFVFVLLWFF